jgi:hypothetical protein
LTARRRAFSLRLKAEDSVAISFGGKKVEDVVSLIAAKKYAQAIEALKSQLKRRGANPSLRMQLADVLVLAEKKNEAIALLLPLADQFATEGFAAKAVSVLKKVQKLDPGRREVESRLARLIEEKQREAVVLPSSTTPTIGMEEGPSAAPASDFADGPALEIGLETMMPISAPAVPPAPAPAPAPTPVESAPLPEPVAPVPMAPAAPPPVAMEPIAAPPPPELVATPPAPPAPSPTPPPLVAPEPEPAIEDYDLLYTDDDDEAAEELPVAVEVIEEAAPAVEPMSAGQFADELMGLVDSVFQEFPGAALETPAAEAAEPPPQGRQIVVSPLFRDFSVDEMVAVIHGLKLLAFERGEVILREGQPGGSLYMLTSGRVRAFKKDGGTGKQATLGDLKEGAFFGEMSILTGQPRMATVVALTRCELLELDRPTLDGITKAHPHVWDVLREFAQQRATPPR